jgi:hypothetical protein
VAQSVATKLVNRAAREHLRPLGLHQKGRSRLWLDDHGWWIVAVDFESPAYEEGTRLLVFADFMWSGRDYLAHTVGGRLRERGRLLNQSGRELRCYLDGDEDAFASCVSGLAERAAAEVTAWREAYPSLTAWAPHLAGAARGGGLWDQYHAAFAAALTGDADGARKWFGRMLGRRPDPDRPDGWAARAVRDAESLHDLLDDPDGFRAEAERRAGVMRRHLGLPGS